MRVPLTIAAVLVGYAAAATLLARGGDPAPRGRDLLLVPGALAAALLRPTVEGWAVAASLLLVGMLRRPRPAAMATPRGFFRRLSDFQLRLALGLLYFPLLAPFALRARLRPDPMRPGGAGGGSLWHPRPAEETGVDRARRQS